MHAPIKTSLWPPDKQTREKVVGEGGPIPPRTGRALILGTDNKNSGPRGHKWLTKVSSTDASALIIIPHQF